VCLLFMLLMTSSNFTNKQTSWRWSFCFHNFEDYATAAAAWCKLSICLYKRLQIECLFVCLLFPSHHQSLCFCWFVCLRWSFCWSSFVQQFLSFFPSQRWSFCCRSFDRVFVVRRRTLWRSCGYLVQAFSLRVVCQGACIQTAVGLRRSLRFLCWEDGSSFS